MTTPCRLEPALWFSDRIEELMEAAYRCNGCQLQAYCRERAPREVHGVWGGIIVGGGKKGLEPIECGNPECSTSFQPKNTRARYCSTRCRDRADRIRRTGKARVEKVRAARKSAA